MGKHAESKRMRVRPGQYSIAAIIASAAKQSRAAKTGQIVLIALHNDGNPACYFLTALAIARQI
jgi:hypothetical protein